MSGTFRTPRIAVILGTIAAVGPFTTDMYLPAFPAVGAELGATPAEVQGTLVTYFLALALGQLAYGPLSDRFGRRLPLLVGFGVYVVSSIGCALAQDIGSLALLRFLQALGGCSGMVIARAVVRDVTDERGAVKLMASLMLVMGVAPIVAPIIGGALLPKVMGAVGDAYDMSRAFIVPMACFAFVAFYGYAWPRLSGSESLGAARPSAGH